MDRRPRFLLLIASLALCATTGALGQVLYKLIDKQGNVTYVDKVPPDYEGEVVRLEPDTPATPWLRPAPAAKPATVPPPPTLNSQRQANREDLEKKLRAAQERFAAAASAKADGDEVRPEEFQRVQRRYPIPKKGEAPPRANCITRNDPGGATYLICPFPVPNDDFYARQKAIDEELGAAQEALQDAERNYRRGVD
jgi:hypothetical protein